MASKSSSEALTSLWRHKLRAGPPARYMCTRCAAGRPSSWSLADTARRCHTSPLGRPAPSASTATAPSSARRRALHATSQRPYPPRAPPGAVSISLPTVEPPDASSPLPDFTPEAVVYPSSSAAAEEGEGGGGGGCAYKDVAVLGGGVTGLSAAFHLARMLPPNATVTLYEAQDRLGGWVRTEELHARGQKAQEAQREAEGGAVGVDTPRLALLEMGPRTLRLAPLEARFDDFVLYELIDLLNLNASVSRISAKAVRALRQYVYFPDRLNEVPGRRESVRKALEMVWGVLAPEWAGGSPLYRGSIAAFLAMRKYTNHRDFAIWGAEMLSSGDGAGGLSWGDAAALGRRGAARPVEGSTVDFSTVPDMSIGDFARRMMGGDGPGSQLVDNAISALLHGIYGGDVDALSVRSALPGGERRYWDLARPLLKLKQQGQGGEASGGQEQQQQQEGQQRGEPSLMYIARKEIELGRELAANPAVARMGENAAEAPLLYFRGGLQSLTNALARALQRGTGKAKVNIKLGGKVTGLKYDEALDRMAVTTTSISNPSAPPITAHHDKVISTLFSGDLYSLAPSELPSLKDSRAVTMGVASFFVPGVPNLHRASLPDPADHAFGYLIPKSVPFQNNANFALGVLFDSDVTTDLAVSAEPRPDAEDAATTTPQQRDADQSTEKAADEFPSTTENGTRLTVMLGGHYWDDLPASSLPTESDLIAMGQATLKNHLGISLDVIPPSTSPSPPPSPSGTSFPAHASAILARNAIPQPVVGHSATMARAHADLARSFRGRLAVAGGSYSGVGVLGALRAGRDAAAAVARATTDDAESPRGGGEGSAGSAAAAGEGRQQHQHPLPHVGQTGLAEFKDGEAGRGPQALRPLVVRADRIFGPDGLKPL